MRRRRFLRHALALPFLVPKWRSAPPRAYTDELTSLMRSAPVPGAVIGALQNHRLSWIAPLGVRAAGSPEPIAINEFLGWGLGWAIERTSGHAYLWQWVDNPGFKNLVLAEPSTGSAIFVFTNGDAGARVYDRVLTHATGHDHPLLFWL